MNYLLSGLLWSVQLVIPLMTHSQEIEAEELTAIQAEGNWSEDDQSWQEKEFVAGNRLLLNEATEDQLRAIGLLTEEQIRQFVLYRKWLGPFIDFYELQAIPGWDTASIRRLLPWLSRECVPIESTSFRQSIREGHHSLLLRMSFTKPDSADRISFEGNGLKLFLRYQYRYRNRIRWGWMGEKDAGESLFRKSNRQGFDFNSFHFFYGGRRWLNGVYLGDFTINLGQGLIQWQNLSLGKSSNAIQTLRQSEPVKPYSSSGEYSFFRGLAVVASYQKWRGVLFLSARRISGRLKTDSAGDEAVLTSIDESGYHRKDSELKGENISRLYSAGIQLQRTGKNFQTDINLVAHRQQHSLQPERIIDSSGIFTGKQRVNASWHYRYQFRNLICFGEMAIDQGTHGAMLHSFVASLHSTLSASLLVRRIHRAYQALFAGTFTDNGKSEDENGWYAGIEYKPTRKLTVQAYTDLFHQNRISVKAHRPVFSTDHSILLQVQPDKKTQVSFRWRRREGESNFNLGLRENGIQQVAKMTYRFQVTIGMGNMVETAIRVDGIGIKQEKEGASSGWMGFAECTIRPPRGGFRIECRYGLYQTENYESRLYARESDMLYSYSVPAFYGKGERGYVLARIKLDDWIKMRSHLTADAWFKMGMTRAWQESARSSLLISYRGSCHWDGRLQVIVGF